jgi:hypothetical protein
MQLCSLEQRAPCAAARLAYGYRPMLITYRRTGRMFTLLALAAVAFAATVLTAVVVAAILIVALAVTVSALVARAVLPRSWRHSAVPAATAWPQETIDTTVVKPTTGSSDERDLLRMDSDQG